MNEGLLFELKQYLQDNLEKLSLKDQTSEAYRIQTDYLQAAPQAMRMALPKKETREETSEEEKQFDISQFKKNGVIAKENEKACYSLSPEIDIEEYLRKTKINDTFSSMLFKYIDETGLSDAEIYKRAGIDRRHFSKIRCEMNYRPKKSTAVSLCLALKLELWQAEELLKLAGYSLSNSDTGDLIVKFCLERRINDLVVVNEALEYFGMKMLGVVQ